MIAEIRLRLAKVPFVPFRIRMADGHEYSVPTVDHIWLPPGGNARVAVATDDGATAILPALLISGLIEVAQPESMPNA